MAAWRVARSRNRPPVGAAGHVERPADAATGLRGADRRRMPAARGRCRRCRRCRAAAGRRKGVETLPMGLPRAAGHPELPLTYPPSTYRRRPAPLGARGIAEPACWSRPIDAHTSNGPPGGAPQRQRPRLTHRRQPRKRPARRIEGGWRPSEPREWSYHGRAGSAAGRKERAEGAQRCWHGPDRGIWTDSARKRLRVLDSPSFNDDNVYCR